MWVLLMCVSMMCFNKNDNYQYLNYPEQVKVLEIDKKYDLQSDWIYDRYWTLDKSNIWRACFSIKDASKMVNI